MNQRIVDKELKRIIASINWNSDDDIISVMNQLGSILCKLSINEDAFETMLRELRKM